MIYITAIHQSGGAGHEHVTEVRWLDGSDGKSDTASLATMIDFIDVKKNRVQVGGSAGPVNVGVWNASNGRAYLRTYADKQWDNNLLSLPRY
jgi:hypothetical protein